jgi:restriction system-associated AAA family ATPase
MKIIKFNYIKGEYPHPLDGFNQLFHFNEDVNRTLPICLAGINGSGKSKLLEKIAEVFYYLINYYSSADNFKTKLQFELEYYHEGKKNTHVKISQLNQSGFPIFEILAKESKTIESTKDQIIKLLPSKIIGYTSGQNETLSKYFEESYSEYSDSVTNLTRFPKEGNVPDSKFVFLDNNVNSFVFISNSIFRNEKDLKLITGKINKLESLESFRIIIQENPKYKNKHTKIDFTPELSAYFASLKKCATTYYYEIETERTTLDFYINRTTIALFKKYFESSFHLYSSLYKLDLLNEILIKRDKFNVRKNAEYLNQKNNYPIVSSDDKVFSIENIRLNLKKNENDIEYFDLSDGEHQWIHVLGSIMMINDPNVLFLLDEPETHFNPQWRSKFISILNEIEHTKSQEFFITTHSPFLISDCPKENVLIFKDGKASKPNIQTYGASMESILQEAFEVLPPMSEKSLLDIKTLQKSSSKKVIEKRIGDFGESIEKFYLYQRLSELNEEETETQTKTKSRVSVKIARKSKAKRVTKRVKKKR